MGGKYRIAALEAFLVGLSALPIVFARHSPLTDVPAHMASYAVMLGHAQRYYAFHWALAGNLGTDLLMIPLGPLLGVEGATRLIVGLIPALTVLGILMIARSLGRPLAFGSILALPFVYSQSFHLGFLNYSLAIALAFIAFALWIRAEGYKWAFAPAAFAIWLCHVSGWGVLVLMVGGYELSRSRGASRPPSARMAGSAADSDGRPDRLGNAPDHVQADRKGTRPSRFAGGPLDVVRPDGVGGGHRCDLLASEVRPIEV